MASVNKVILIGNLGQDPEIRYTQAGEPIANFSLATNEDWTDKSGQKQERTEWHRVEVFGKTAQVVRDYLTKGKPVYVEGSIRYDEWTDKDGNKRNTTKIRVSGPDSRLVLLGGRGEGGGGGARAAVAGAGAAGRGRRRRRRRLPGLRRRRPVLAASPQQAGPGRSMTSLLALERYVPPYRYDQEEVTRWVRSGCPREAGRGAEPRPRRAAALGLRLGGRRDARERRAHRGGLPPRRLRDPERATARSPARPASTWRAARWPPRGSPPPTSRWLVSVSCTGFMIPAVDAYVADALGMGPRLARLPITESGCAGGVVGLARAADYLAAHPERAALVLALEFSSLTFQRWDRSATNVVSTAIFGDGGAAVVLVGASTRAPPRAACALRGATASSSPAPRTSWASGCATRACRSCSTAARALRAPRGRPTRRGLPERARPRPRADVSRWVLHPGGRRIIEVMAEQLGLGAAGPGAHRGRALRARQHELGHGAVRARRDPAHAAGRSPAALGLLGGLRPRLRRRAGAGRVRVSGCAPDLGAARHRRRSCSTWASPTSEARRSLADLRFVNRWLGPRRPAARRGAPPAAPAAACSTWAAARATCPPT